MGRLHPNHPDFYLLMLTEKSYILQVLAFLRYETVSPHVLEGRIPIVQSEKESPRIQQGRDEVLFQIPAADSPFFQSFVISLASMKSDSSRALSSISFIPPSDRVIVYEHHRFEV